jgi:hypothetical protein
MTRTFRQCDGVTSAVRKSGRVHPWVSLGGEAKERSEADDGPNANINGWQVPRLFMAYKLTANRLVIQSRN